MENPDKNPDGKSRLKIQIENPDRKSRWKIQTENPDRKSRWKSRQKIHMENLVAWTLDVNKATHLREAALRVERQELQPFPNELSTLMIQHINDSAL